jgi:hypothetical protein
MLWADTAATQASIRQFSDADADTWPEYEAWLAQCRELVQPMLGALPAPGDSAGTLLQRAAEAAKTAFSNRYVSPASSKPCIHRTA